LQGGFSTCDCFIPRNDKNSKAIMIPSTRKTYNQNFSDEKYQQLLKKLGRATPVSIDFRIAETPVFLPMILKTS
jgi:hypothetical protein